VSTLPNFISSKRLDTWKPKATAVAEFSFAEPLEEFKQFLGNIRFDPARIVYYRDYMEEIPVDMREGVNVVGMLA